MAVRWAAYNHFMPHMEKHAPGTFCWVELATTDQDGAKHFYGSLFGWTFVDYPMGPGDFYTMFRLDGRDAAAGYTMREREKGVPPHWNLYVAVEDADRSAARAVELGGKVPAGAFDVYTNGRMAVVIDPGGAAFCLWQPKQTQGVAVMGENNSYCWADLVTSDRIRAKQFYEGLFGWKIVPGKDKDESTYLHIGVGEQFFAGIQPDRMRPPGVPPHWLPYFMTADADASAAKAKELGATVLVPPMTVEQSLRFSVLADPQGAVFALFQQ
jgi:predicted enzyme related to lactoylglutathione lyase